MELLFAFAAGLLTLLNPCVLPVLPVALASSLAGHKYGPVALAAGMAVSFSVLGVAIASLGPAIGLTADRVSQIGALVMIGFGIVLLVPRLNEQFAFATGGMANRANSSLDRLGNDGMWPQFAGGALLGAVWVPCIGPTIGGAISLASQGQSLGWAGLIMFAFSLGVSTIILGLAYGAREAIRTRQASLRAMAEYAKPVMGTVFIVIGLLIFFHILPAFEAWLLDQMPVWLQDLSTIF